MGIRRFWTKVNHLESHAEDAYRVIKEKKQKQNLGREEGGLTGTSYDTNMTGRTRSKYPATVRQGRPYAPRPPLVVSSAPARHAMRSRASVCNFPRLALSSPACLPAAMDFGRPCLCCGECGP